MTRFSFNVNRLPVQLIFSFLAVVLLTAILLGLPAIWLLQNQMDQQAWAQVEQAQRTAISLYEKKAFELENAANLTAQRPTLYLLLESNDLQPLEEYLFTLQNGANLDLINICHSGDLIGGTQKQILLCENLPVGNFYLDGIDAWMIAQTRLDDKYPGQVVVGVKLDDKYSFEIRDQIGLDQALFYQDQLISSSFNLGAEQISNLQECIAEDTSQLPHLSCTAGNAGHYITISPLDEKGFFVAVAMDISEISIAENRLILWMAAAICGIAVIVTLIGVVLSRRISRPLVKLSKNAESFSQGDLETSVITESKLIEITRVARALDNARMDLQEILKSLKDERDWSDNLLASIVEGIITLDRDGRITFFSHGAERLTGLLDSEVRGDQINDVFPLADSPDTFFSLISSSEEGYQKLDVSLADGSVTSLAITSARLTRSGVVDDEEIALVIRDISEEEAVHRLLGYFLANVSHELRTPLTALEASIEMLLDPDGNLTSMERNELYISLHLGIFRLHTLFDNLLEGANIEARRFRISPRVVDLAPIVAEAVQTMQPLLFKYDQHLSVDMPLEPPRVLADKRRIVQVLVNLISNANKYGPPGEDICLEVSATSEMIRLVVKDRGPGIPHDQRDNLFGRFVFPQEGVEISQAGAGLGLSVVKAIVEAHGGEVSVKDRPGGGSQFWFTLPVASEEK
ncbi:MAG: PAS domain S-box protein [Anaerolineales bacterium]|nr:PAS domain S-box protein [Anaerolineales bacterium]